MSDVHDQGPRRVEIRTATIRISGALGLLLAIPVLFVFGAVALACLVAGLTAMMVAPGLFRHAERETGREELDSEDAITLADTAYRTIDEPRARRLALPRLSGPRVATATQRPRSR